jgi:phosphoribosyl 1,2-cyclic phosphodiesterase
LLTVSFHGVRGSTPCACASNQRYGGNTSCVTLEAPGCDPILLDIGTGLRFFGDTQPKDGSFRGTALVSHLHWDHVQGLPFFTPALVPGSSLRLYAPAQDSGEPVHDVFDRFMCPPYFPVRMADLPGDIRFEDADDGHFTVGSARVLARTIPHVGKTLGYRIEWEGVSVAYLPDHQQPYDGSYTATDAALELADGADLLIHDAQYTPAEFSRKATWGHCTVEYALWLAREASVKRLALFHHDPVRDDDALDHIVGCSTVFGDKHGVEVLAASEGLEVGL